MLLWQHIQLQLLLCRNGYPCIWSWANTVHFLKLIRRASAIWELHVLKMGWIISPYTVKQAAFDLQQKDTGSKTCLSNIKIYVMWRISQCTTCLPNSKILYHYLQRYSLFCVLTSILSHLMTSSVPNLHNTTIVNISGTRWDMTKRKTPFFFTFKGLSTSPLFQYLNFSFHRHSEDGDQTLADDWTKEIYKSEE